MTITNLGETTWMVQYPWPVEITYEQGGNFLGREFKSSLIGKENGIKMKPAFSGSSQENGTIEVIIQILRNLVHTYNLQET